MVAKALQTAVKAKTPVFILSGGSNVLFSDKGFDGLVVHVKSSGVSIKGTRIFADAGVSMASLVRTAAVRGLAGLEWAGGLPGTLGGAVRGNAGAFGGEIKDVIVFVRAIDGKGRVRMFSKNQCRFSYRSSIFKQKKYVVLSVALGLQKGDTKELSRIARSHVRYRKERHPLEYPNAGSVFKNCDAAKLSAKWKKYFADKIKQDPFPVVPTAVLIAEAGLKGLRIGNAEISKKHPNYIVNLGGCSAKDIVALIARVKKLVYKKFGVRLEEEIQFV
jgi:UDP-N-acetylmuramate dehydrogenase